MLMVVAPLAVSPAGCAAGSGRQQEAREALQEYSASVLNVLTSCARCAGEGVTNNSCSAPAQHGLPLFTKQAAKDVARSCLRSVQ